MVKKDGIIYKITNTVNNKVYIGKTKRFYGKAKYGYTSRFKEHMNNAFSESETRKSECPRFYNAIRKYGRDKFKIKILAKCKLEMCDDLEIAYIDIFDSTNSEMGYNISKGGGGRSVVHVSEESRKKISKYSEDEENTLNIRPYHKNGQLVGYSVRRRERGEAYQKRFGSTDKTPAENYLLAVECLKNFKNGEVNDNKYNKENDLPRNISYAKRNGKIEGYKVSVMINGIKTNRTIQDQSKTLDEVLQIAIQVKESILNASKNIKVV